MMDHNDVIDLTAQLVELSTEAGQDTGGLELISARLKKYGFTTTLLEAGGRKNLLALRGQGPEYFAFSGHTDVVPPGDGWTSPPFHAVVREGRLYGRGVADMKGAVAAFTLAVERYLLAQPDSTMPIAFLIAGDEETESVGTPALLEELGRRGLRIRWCLVGEPSSTDRLGDCIKVGRRGSLTGRITCKGIQGHVAYPHLAHNPLHDLTRLMVWLQEFDLDSHIPAADSSLPVDSTAWPRTTLQLTLITGGVEGATNMIPETATARFNIRYRMPHTRDSLVSLLEGGIRHAGFNPGFTWGAGLLPYDSPTGKWRELVGQVVQDECGITARLTRDGGSSDGRFVAKTGASVVELGPCNATIHKVNEYLEVAELKKLVDLYTRLLERVEQSW